MEESDLENLAAEALFLRSSVGRAAVFGSGGLRGGGLLKGRGAKFFFLFLVEKR